MRSFASDNNAGVHPRVLARLQKVAHEYSPAYGADKYTQEVTEKLNTLFGPGAEAHLVFNGTAANVLGISAFLQPHQCVLAPASAHLLEDECGALERFSGVSTIAIPTETGKISPQDLAPWMERIGDVHRSQPRVVTISQSTETGMLYSPGEIRALADFAHQHAMILHVDGARFANAAASLGLSARELSRDLGIDILSFGGTKNGLMLGEAVIFFNHAAKSKSFPFLRKQGMNLASKMRFISAQFLEYLNEDLWLENARHANAMAKRLATQVAGIAGLRMAYPTQANGVFVALPVEVIETLRKDFYFYTWNSATSVVRLMTSFETSVEDVDALAEALRKAL